MNFSRTTTTIALLQTMLLLLGISGMGMLMKLKGYPDNVWLPVTWNRLPVFLREHGTWFLLVPLVWVALANAAQHRAGFIISYKSICAIGFVLAIGLLLLFIYAGFDPYTETWSKNFRN